ncbi:MAG: hypothetical protein U0166_05450 [Acidobacteriota bacterium]
MPWLHGRYETTPAFEEVRALFERELALMEADDWGAWDEVWAQIEAPGLVLRYADGRPDALGLVIHFDGSEAWWRH